jgi:hypothetical protein
VSFPKVFIGQVKDLAKEIAFHQRGVRELQDVKVLEDKYEGELKELQESKYPEEEIPDIVYYACQLYFKGHKVYLTQVEQLLEVYGLDEFQAQRITLAKYRLRAAGPNRKDLAAEREAIREALR